MLRSQDQLGGLFGEAGFGNVYFPGQRIPYFWEVLDSCLCLLAPGNFARSAKSCGRPWPVRYWQTSGYWRTTSARSHMAKPSEVTLCSTDLDSNFVTFFAPSHFLYLLSQFATNWQTSTVPNIVGSNNLACSSFLSSLI